jgi:hypothetical protein
MNKVLDKEREVKFVLERCRIREEKLIRCWMKKEK